MKIKRFIASLLIVLIIFSVPATSAYATDIISKPSASYEQLVKWAENNNASKIYIDNLKYIWDKSIERGVDPILVATQTALETGYMKSYVFKNNNNTAGIKETESTYRKYKTVHDGIDAQIGHLALYAGKSDVESWLNGWCTTIEGLSGTWAEDPNYSKKILSMIDSIKQTKVEPKKPTNVIKETIEENRKEEGNLIENAIARRNKEKKNIIERVKEKFKSLLN